MNRWRKFLRCLDRGEHNEAAARTFRRHANGHVYSYEVCDDCGWSTNPREEVPSW